MDPWQVAIALAGTVAAVAGAYAKLVQYVNRSADRREERSQHLTELLMELVRNNTRALDQVCSQGGLHSNALEDHDLQAKEIAVDVRIIKTDVKDIKAFLEPPPKRAGMG